MPRRNNIGLRLSQLHELGQIVRVQCFFCKSPERFYRAADMMTLLGDAELDSLRSRLKCEDCGRRDYVEVEGKWLEAVEKNGLIVRCLVRVDTIRRPIWRDERR